MSDWSWFNVRQQLKIIDTALGSKDNVVEAYCPQCDHLIGSWPEGGIVEPPSLWRGEYTCPCGWKPTVS